MKATVNVKKEINITHVLVEVPVRYGDDDMPYNFPFRKGNIWKAMINVDKGIIENWPAGKTGDFYMKVINQGIYTLIDDTGTNIAEIRNFYCPNDLIPGEYGDYINLVIDEQGIITNWMTGRTEVSFDAFFHESCSNCGLIERQ